MSHSKEWKPSGLQQGVGHHNTGVTTSVSNEDGDSWNKPSTAPAPQITATEQQELLKVI